MANSLSLVATLRGTNIMTADPRCTHRFPRQTGQLTLLQMERLGFLIEKEIDHWFLSVQFPAGWYKERDHGHPGWWMVCDKQDRIRCQLMEGNSNFDGILANWLRRYDYDVQWHPSDPAQMRWVILDGGDILIESEWAVGKPDRMVQLGQCYGRKAIDWLERHHPKWRNFLAYW